MGSTSERLPSFKGPRDLSLSSRGGAKKDASSGQARPRRVFVPNIPPKRDKANAPAPDASSSSSKDSATPGSSNARGRHQRGRGNFRGGPRPGSKPRPELVQSESIFSGGIGDPMESKRSSVTSYKSGHSSSRYKSQGGPVRISSMNRNTLNNIIKQEDSSETDKKLFGDEKFEPGNADDIDPSNPNVPVVLPLISYVPELFADPETLDLPKTTIKQEPGENEEDIRPAAIAQISIKQEAVEDHYFHRETDWKGLLAAIPLESTSFAGTFRSTPPEGSLVYFQLPDGLPVLEGRDSDKNSNKDSNKLVQDITQLPEGLVGRFQILSTGQTRFVLGQNTFDVDPGSSVGFLQELHSVDIENKTLTNLGPINRKFVITPDIDQLLSSGNK